MKTAAEIGPIIERLFRADPLHKALPAESWLAAQLTAIEIAGGKAKPRFVEKAKRYYGEELIACL
ncbi:hypothetical protein [Bradyrhizobium sp. DASA03007]|uniref:hypothetical protein n=1 Tax=unclassified Bradyrhizobium TaxID=2631580 RepID=UPI003F6F70E5